MLTSAKHNCIIKNQQFKSFNVPAFGQRPQIKKVATPNILLDYWCQQQTSLLISCTLAQWGIRKIFDKHNLHYTRYTIVQALETKKGLNNLKIYDAGKMCPSVKPKKIKKQ